jgi:hypothetical protein
MTGVALPLLANEYPTTVPALLSIFATLATSPDKDGKTVIAAGSLPLQVKL